jgi:hypothetical protein
MQLPLSILIFWIQRDSDESAMMCATWYNKENYLPSTTEQKRILLKILSKKDVCLFL